MGFFSSSSSSPSPAASGFPHATRLNLGGFRFYRFLPQALRFIAGFGQMGWLAGTTYLADCPGFSPEESRQLLTELQRTTGWTLLTLDPYGLNLSTSTDTNLRVSTPSPLLAPEAFAAWSRQILSTLT
ncbi:hypothetical protein [Leeia oryzae]|uniref:hypothetical protein n=1 Tax=Leeia oryzae TaxID=356662 RepID=UPI00035C41A7|nr:hypothetical protein [Leeia oryzae]